MRTSLFSMLVVLGAMGCSPIPFPTVAEPTPQPQLLAAKHWKDVAVDVSNRMSSALADVRDQGLVVHIQPPERSTMFSNAFAELLRTEMLQRGFGVTANPNEAQLMMTFAVLDGGPAGYYAMGTSPADPIGVVDRDIVLTIAAFSGERFVTRISDVYYIKADTVGEYIARGPVPMPMRNIEVIGP